MAEARKAHGQKTCEQGVLCQDPSLTVDAAPGCMQLINT